MNFKIGIFGFLAAILLIVSCSKENIDTSTEEEEENPTTVVDCNLSATIVIDSIAELEFTYSVRVEGGTNPYTYSWATGEDTESIQLEELVDNAIVVTDAEGCVATDSIILQGMDPCEGFVGGINDSLSSSELFAWVSGGTEPYAYLWSTGETTSSITATEPGNYDLLIIDALECAIAYTYNVVSTDPCNGLEVLIQQDNLSNFIWATASGGNGSYTYEWSTGQTIPQIEATESGTYTVTVTDSEGCTATFSITVTLDADPCGNFEMYIQQDSLSTEIYGLAAGGTSPYNYLWSTGETTISIIGEVGSTYSVTIYDANECTLEGSYQVQ